MGEYFIGTASYGFLLDPQGHLTTLSVPGWSVVAINGIDDRSDIVGVYQDANGGYHSFYGQAVPEPGSLAMRAAGAVGVAVLATRRRR